MKARVASDLDHEMIHAFFVNNIGKIGMQIDELIKGVPRSMIDSVRCGFAFYLLRQSLIHLEGKSRCAFDLEIDFFLKNLEELKVIDGSDTK